MAVRLTVVMTDTAPTTGAAQSLSSDIVGNLIGLPGIDLNLVGALDSIDGSTTDGLMMGGVSGDVAVLDWRSPEAIVDVLKRTGFLGHRAPHPHDHQVGPVPPGQRRIYAFDLNQVANADEVISALKHLNQERQVRTFTLGMPTLDGGPVSNPDANTSADLLKNPSKFVSSNNDGPDQSVAGGPSAGPGTREPETPARQPPDESLDRLIDQLDQLDL